MQHLCSRLPPSSSTSSTSRQSDRIDSSILSQNKAVHIDTSELLTAFGLSPVSKEDRSASAVSASGANSVASVSSPSTGTSNPLHDVLLAILSADSRNTSSQGFNQRPYCESPEKLYDNCSHFVDMIFAWYRKSWGPKPEEDLILVDSLDDSGLQCVSVTCRYKKIYAIRCKLAFIARQVKKGDPGCVIRREHARHGEICPYKGPPPAKMHKLSSAPKVPASASSLK